MWRDWLDEYRRHPVPAGILAFTGFAAVVVFAVVFTIRHTGADLPAGAPISKPVMVKPGPRPTVTITEHRTITPTRTVMQTFTPERQVTSPPARSKSPEITPVATTPAPEAGSGPPPTEETPTPTETPTVTETPTYGSGTT